LDLSISRQKDVVGLKVTIHLKGSMEVRECARQLTSDVVQLIVGKPSRATR
jgi:hypothetical protein